MTFTRTSSSISPTHTTSPATSRAFVAFRFARALFALALCACALSACGLGGSTTVVNTFQVGGPSGVTTSQFDSATISQQLAASAGDIDKLSKVTVTAARLESTDGQDLSYLAGEELKVHASGSSDQSLAKLDTGPGTVGLIDLPVDSTIDLKPAIKAGGTITLQLDIPTRPVTARGLKFTLTIRGEI